MKKISVVGGGTAGLLTAFTLSKGVNFEVDLYLDKSIPPQNVGEGANYTLVDEMKLHNFIDGDFINKVKGTRKFGIQKTDFGGTGNFFHNFLFGNYSIHFDSKLFRKYISTEYGKINIIDKNITSLDDIDSHFKWDCRGYDNKNSDDFNYMTGIPVNSTYVVQCYWDKPRFEHTKSIAMRHGWVFMIPLQDRCSVGYVYNSSISKLEDIKEDINDVFDRYDLKKSDETKAISFKNYYRKNNFTKNTAYNGNSSFFAEPMEATTLGNVISIARGSINLLYGDSLLDQINDRYEMLHKNTEAVIAINYLSGSIYDSEFWKFAKYNSEQFFKNEFNKNHLSNILDYYKRIESNNLVGKINFEGFISWPPESWYENIKGFDCYEALKKLV